MYNLFIQFQNESDLNNPKDLDNNIQDIGYSDIFNQEILERFNIYALAKYNPQIFQALKKKTGEFLYDGYVFLSEIDEEDNIGMNFFENSLSNILLVIDNSKNLYTLYDGVDIKNGKLINMFNSKLDLDKYCYSSLDEAYKHIKYMYVLE